MMKGLCAVLLSASSQSVFELVGRQTAPDRRRHLYAWALERGSSPTVRWSDQVLCFLHRGTAVISGDNLNRAIAHMLFW